MKILLLLAVTAAPASVYADSGKTGTALFAGGCFWCMVAPYETLPGVISVTAGYTGGHVPHPSYDDVSSGTTGHAESVRVIYDPAKVSYNKLLDIYWHNIDPTTPKRQFCDSGDQYRTAIFYQDDEQKRAAIASRDALAASGVLKAPIVTEIVAATEFYPAEEYHQDYYRKKDIQYQIYRHACGRDQRLQELYGPAAGH